MLQQYLGLELDFDSHPERQTKPAYLWKKKILIKFLMSLVLLPELFSVALSSCL